MAAGVFKDLTGFQFGDWAVLGRSSSRGHRVMWHCQCVCGRLKDITTDNLTLGRSTTCRQCSNKKFILHGESHGPDNKKPPLYVAWQNRILSKHGCCKTWQNYLTFKRWALSNGWKPGLWVHRRKDKGIYSPTNCYIASADEQAKGGRSHHAKLIPEEVRAIHQLHTAGTPASDMAHQFKVSRRHVLDILRGDRWKHIHAEFNNS